MITRLFAAADLTVHARCGETLRQWRADPQVIDAETGIAGKGVPEILPEGVDPLARVQSPERGGPTLAQPFVRRESLSKPSV